MNHLPEKNAKPRVLHLITGLGVGGAEQMLLRTVPRLEQFDNCVCALLADGPMGKKLREHGVKVEILEFSFLNPLPGVLKFRKLITKYKPDVIITYLIHADLFGRILGRLFGAKVIICSQRGSLLGWEFLRSVDRITKSLVTRYIVQTETAKSELSRRLGVSLSKFRVIPNGLELQNYSTQDNLSLRTSLGVPPAHIVFACVGNLRVGKGHHQLLEAFEKLYQKHTNIMLLIVGEGDQKAPLLAQVQDYSSKDKILFLGYRDDVGDVLRSSDVFVLATYAEGMSNAILEAMASGRAIITTNIPVNKEIITPQTGLLVSPGDVEELYAAMQKLVENPDLRQALRINAQEYVAKNLSIESVVKRFSEVVIESLEDGLTQ